MQGAASDLQAMMSWGLETTQKKASNQGIKFVFPTVLLCTCPFAQLRSWWTLPLNRHSQDHFSSPVARGETGTYLQRSAVDVEALLSVVCGEPGVNSWWLLAFTLKKEGM